jgi:NADPH:quinone reductase-like Zn-dependent oxidoreductase
MPYPRVIPHSDAAGVVDSVGEGVDPARIGRRSWVYGAQSYRPFGTAAEYLVVPAALAVNLPDTVPDEVGACLGIPGITAHRAVFGEGRSRVPPCWCTASSAASDPSPPSSPAGAAQTDREQRDHDCLDSH